MGAESIFIRNCSARDFRKEGHKDVPSPLPCPKAFITRPKESFGKGSMDHSGLISGLDLYQKLMALISSSEPPVGPTTPIGSNNNHPYLGKELSPGGSSGSSWEVLTSWPPVVPCPRTSREAVLQGRSPESPLNRSKRVDQKGTPRNTD